MFQRTRVIEILLSDFHSMIVTVMRRTFKKVWPRIMNYKSNKHFYNETFVISLESNLFKEVYIHNVGGLENFAKQPQIL